MKQLSNGFVYSLLRIGGSVFKATRGLLESPMESIFIHPTRARLMVTSISNTDRDIIPAVARLSIRAEKVHSIGCLCLRLIIVERVKE